MKIDFLTERNTCDKCDEMEICVVVIVEGDRWFALCKNCLCDCIDEIDKEYERRKQ
jgi:hypothetical protein